MFSVPPIIQIVGYSNTGKTTLITYLIKHFQQSGRRVGVIKRDGHDHEWDQEGKDTRKFRDAGAPLVAIQSPTKMAWFEQPPLSLPVLIERMHQAGAQLIIVEGFKTASYPKLLLIRELSHLALLDSLTNCRGIVSWFPLEDQGLPVYSIEQPQQVAAFAESLF
ncbi:molybdopterin-guanine dinucleotide biosynthesis protein B [Brevibacillus humidisoli]|uniref:molybdopterin-guanine dinucleotide biosynthesis protein B n=1 Tax=Brevibacillus humidisoli TaxID=2895522 RepID=UPI001E31509A|nr:molybdopterin-guanine dinucleotide biosynthesis protein B [Brevibacillus humidisoli]UFJ42110.1 molybdopterin-guanine dinucleotide biosynthesis protein B [Brevibacillus humidisoli]